MTDEIIAENLKIFGVNKFKNSTEYAKALDMKSQSLYKYINGESVPGGLILKKLAQLGCDINWLLTGESYNSPEAEEMDRKDRERLDNHDARFDKLEKAVLELSETNSKILEHLRSIDREQRNFRSKIKTLESKNGF